MMCAGAGHTRLRWAGLGWAGGTRCGGLYLFSAVDRSARASIFRLEAGTDRGAVKDRVPVFIFYLFFTVLYSHP